MSKASVPTPNTGSVSVFGENKVFRRSVSNRERELSIVIPTYNEAENIGALIQRVLGVFQRGEVDGELIIVDDGSPDGTGGIVKEYVQKFDNVTLVLRKGKKGLGNAYKDGIRLTCGGVIMGMDADFSHNPDEILRIYHSARNYDIVIGSRYVHGGGIVGWNFFRRVVSRTANLLVNLFFRLGVHDSTSGFRAFKREAIMRILPHVNCFGYDFLVEILIRSRKFNLTIKEIPITFKDRSRGKSKLGLKQFVLFLRLLLNELKR